MTESPDPTTTTRLYTGDVEAYSTYSYSTRTSRSSLGLFYGNAGAISYFTPAPDCFSQRGVRFSTSTLSYTGGDSSIKTVWTSSVGCYIGGPNSCCPSNFRGNVYYTGGDGKCPSGYIGLPTKSEYIVVLFKTQQNYGDDPKALLTATPCCPTFNYTLPMAKSSGVAYPISVKKAAYDRDSLTGVYARENELAAVTCSYIIIEEVYTRSGTVYGDEHSIIATPIYVFDGPPLERGLPMPAVIGIAVGVGIPVLLIAAFIIYKFTRRRSKSGSNDSATADPDKVEDNGGEIGGIEPGIMDNPGESGIESYASNKRRR